MQTGLKAIRIVCALLLGATLHHIYISANWLQEPARIV